MWGTNDTYNSLTRTLCLSLASCQEPGWQCKQKREDPPDPIPRAGPGIGCLTSGHHQAQGVNQAIFWLSCGRAWSRQGLQFCCACLQVLAWAVEKKPKQLTRQNLVRPLLHMLLKMATEPDEGENKDDGDDDDDDEDDEDAPPRKLASQVRIATVQCHP